MNTQQQNQIMNIKFWGTRGSRTVADADFLRYGGNTTCVEVNVGKNVLVFDAGSGFNKFAKNYQERVQAGEANPYLHIFLSHPHPDHTMGLEQPALMFDGTIAKTLHAGAFRRVGEEVTLGWSAEQLYAGLFRQPYSADLGELHRKFGKLGLANHDLDNTVVIGSGPEKISVTAFAVPHISLPLGANDLSVGFRITSGSTSACILTDFSNEYGETGKPIIDMDIVDKIRGADLLIADSMYSDADLCRNPALKGFGHTTRETVATYAARAGIKRVIHTHHNPDDNDDKLKTRELINAFGAGLKGVFAVFAKEGRTLPLAPLPPVNYRPQAELVGHEVG